MEPDGGASNVLSDALEQALYGNFSDKDTLLGTALQIALGFTPIDWIADARDIAYDVTHWEATPEHMLQTALDVIGLIPGIGNIAKKGAKVVGATVPIIKNAGALGAMVGSLNKLDNLADGAKNAQKAAEALTTTGKGLDDAAQGIAKNLDSIGDAVGDTSKAVSGAFGEVGRVADDAVKGAGSNVVNSSSTGRAANKLAPDPNATGAHSTFKRNPTTGEITNYRTWEPNPRNPLGFDNVKGYDGIGTPHRNKITGEPLMPHIHEKTTPDGVRTPEPWEIPRRR